ncbi:MAG: transglutaminaseTgpA domain-containing protein [Thermaerobacter sp.]|nr:transglutaminaseTgpA domain-containing protein [Thermaerobacter sp.]
MDRITLWLRAMWLTALFWPYAHAGGIPHASALAAAPIVFAAMELISRWVWRIVYLVLALAVQWLWQWMAIPSSRVVWASLVLAVTSLTHLPIAAWNQLNAHIAAPLLLIGAALGWLVFRSARDRTRLWALLATGAMLLPIDHVFWDLPAQIPLVAFLAIGLCLLAIEHGQGLTDARTRIGWGRQAALAAVAMAPVLVGVATPAHPSADPFGLFTGWSGGNLGAATLGIASGTVSVNRSVTPSNTPVLFIRSPYPAYWQAEVYTTFTGTAWRNPSTTAPYAVPSQLNSLPLFPPSFNAVATSRFTAQVEALNGRNLTTLVYSGVPLNFSIPVIFHPDSSRFTATPVASYRMALIVPLFSRQLLAQDPLTSLPAGGLARDLAVPAGLGKVARLAQTITAGDSSWWAKAMAVKSWLDQHYRYSFHFTPARSDVVTHFLFHDHTGYCDQFSTTFIVMMRTLGIPARWVVGYGPGTYQPSRGGFLIRAIDAHSWAQIYIPPYGWVPVDPTPGWHIPGASPASPGTLRENVSPPVTSPATRPSVAPSAHPLANRLPAASAKSKPSDPRPGGHGSNPTSAQSSPWFVGSVWLTIAAGVMLVIVRHVRKLVNGPGSWIWLWRVFRWWTRVRLGRSVRGMTPRDIGMQLLACGLAQSDTIQPLVHSLEAAFYGPGLRLPAERSGAWQAFHALRRQSGQMRPKHLFPR